ncbi:bifunctional cytidylate kinase/GTPase Der [Corynebacterium choanae]|uniref:Multifunctional fusion protein n=1 Tax=Corynebacterium choanae TaxID=1862358 RepID=A0A3G6JAK0_9CORY|nr:bifunctional cytidylate kinase/GTPase Der [Corynebacterium choanae]AZA13500.1 GTPase Der [Corynebacterium choanae]
MTHSTNPGYSPQDYAGYDQINNQPNNGLLLAIDGPSGTGKSTVARALAQILGAQYLDTGAMYRVATLYCQQQGIDLADEAAVVAATADLPLVISDDPQSTAVLLGGKDVQTAIREADVTNNVSQVAAYQGVRSNLVALQQQLAHDAGRCVVEGRDIGTVVLPEAPAKVFLTASAEQRANRRYQQDKAAGRNVTLDEVLQAVIARDEYDSTRAVSPLQPADDADIIDTSDYDQQTVIDIVLDVVLDSAVQQGYLDPSLIEDDDEQDLDDDTTAVDAQPQSDDELSVTYVTAEDYLATDGSFDDTDFAIDLDNPDFTKELDDEQWAAIEANFGLENAAQQHTEEALPTVAIVGRPNVGKSTLVNRFLGRREAVVEDFPGVTRDRVSYVAEWNGRRYFVQDTGGWDPDAKGIHASIARQAEIAMAEADVIVMVVDTKVGITETDAVMAKKLQRSQVPVLLVANKFDSDNQYGDVAEFWGLGLGYPWPVSAQHGRGGADVLDEVINLFPEVPRNTTITEGPRRVALVGKPNVGKSSLLNKITGDDRSVVDNVAGTTVDPVDSLVQLDQHLWRFVDTAGLRKKVKTASGHEYYAYLRTKAAIDAAEVCVFLIDASSPISEQDQKILNLVVESGRALVIAYNKWDLVDEDRRYELEREIERQLAYIPWARRVNISAKTGRALQKIEPFLLEALESWDQRISTGRLNNWLRTVIAANPPAMRGGRLPRVLFATQAASRPPVIVLFTTGFLDHGYRRFLERRLREEFGFPGSPIRIAVRVREKRSR